LSLVNRGVRGESKRCSAGACAAPLEGNASSLPTFCRGNGVVSSDKQYFEYMQHVGRKSPIHQPIFESGNLTPVVFVTVCAASRKPILATSQSHDLLLTAWGVAHHWVVGRYVILPDHLHMFVSPASANPASLARWMRYWKSIASRDWPDVKEQPIWQIGFWDSQIRRGESYDSKWEYVRNNPVRHGLATRAEDWPFQGELNTLLWHAA